MNETTAMFSQQQIALVLSKIEKVSKLQTVEDNDYFENGEVYSPSYSGNFDDAYNEGERTGYISFARELMKMLTSDN